LLIHLKVAWTHVFEQINVLYQVEYGVGTKVKGVEQFRTAFKGYGHTCIITDLMPRYNFTNDPFEICIGPLIV
jgi:hypothetical protein